MNSKKLFLTSSGLSADMKKKFFDIIGKCPEDVKVLYIPTAGIETDGAREGFAVCFQELSSMGIRYENILVYNLELILSKDYQRTYSTCVTDPYMLTRLLTIEELQSFDAVVVSGGDAAVLCREMIRTGFDRTIEKAINNGLVYVGISAGSMYAAGNLDDGLNFSNKALEHMGESGCQVPVQTLQDAIRYGEAMPDPRGSNTTMYYTTMYKNGKMYNLEVLYDEISNTVYHFEYARKAMGNLPAIPK